MRLSGKFNRYQISSGVIAAVVAIGIYADHQQHEVNRPTLMQASNLASVTMKPAPINKDWITEGTPVTEAGFVAQTYDTSAKVMIWRTTASKFTWHYDIDEVVTILDGDVFITDTDGSTKHLVAGDVALFPAGAVLKWNVPDHVTKSAILKRRVPKPFETALRWLRGLKSSVSPDQAFAG